MENVGDTSHVCELRWSKARQLDFQVFKHSGTTTPTAEPQERQQIDKLDNN